MSTYFFPKKEKRKKKKFVGVVLSIERTLLFAHFTFNHHLSHFTTLFKTRLTSVKNSLSSKEV